MNQEAHVESLKTKHANLDDQILSENQRPIPDSLRVSELKKRKLRIKDEIARLGIS